MLSVSTILSAILLPIAAYLGKITVESYASFIVRKKKRHNLLTNAIAEIELILKSVTTYLKEFHAAFDAGVIRRNVETDPEYALFVAGLREFHLQSSLQVLQDTEFASDQFQTACYPFVYWAQRVHGSLEDLRSSDFRRLNNERKISALQKMMQDIEHLMAAGHSLLPEIEKEKARLVKLSFLSHYILR